MNTLQGLGTNKINTVFLKRAKAVVNLFAIKKLRIKKVINIVLFIYIMAYKYISAVDF